jgi:hypothetical protein
MTTKTQSPIDIIEQQLRLINNRPDLERVWTLLKEVESLLETKQLYLFQVGDKVRFKGKHNRILEGVIQVINRKTVTVSVTERIGVGNSSYDKKSNWRVYPSMLTKVDN